MGKTTEDTAMELDGEGAANFEQLQDLIRKECDKRDRKYAWLEDKCNKLEQQVTQKNHQKNAKEGPISKPQRTRRLEEKQIKRKARYEPTKDSPKKRPCQQLWPKNRRNPESPGQAAEKTAVPGLKTQTNKHCSRKTNQIGIRAVTFTTWTWAKIHPHTKPNEFMESTFKNPHMTDFSAPCTYDSTLLENPPATVQLPTTQNYTSIRHGHPHIGQYHQLLWRNAYNAFLQLIANSSKHTKAKPIFCHTNTEHYEHYNNNKRSLSSHAIGTTDPRLSNVTTI